MSMISASAIRENDTETGVRCGKDAGVFTTIYEDDVNCAIWDRDAPDAGKFGLLDDTLMRLKLEGIVPATEVFDWLDKRLPSAAAPLAQDVACLADMYACLFDAEVLGIRLKSLRGAMCPRFHVDRLGCRLLTTYSGSGTEYLDNTDVDRSLIGKPSSDPLRLPFSHAQAEVRQVPVGAVALAKGEGWPGNEGRGFVHRSPDPGDGYRIFLSIDGPSSGA